MVSTSTHTSVQRRRRQWTLALVTVASLLERADEALLPAVYREVGAELGASPAALGSLTLCRALVQAVCYPLAACAAARHDRARVVAAGAFLWAVPTMLVGVSGTFVQMAIARGFNGVGLALVVPAMNSLAADYSDDTTRGSAFGWLGMASRVGAMMGGTLGVLLAPTTFLGVHGWRLAFHILALLSFALAVSTWFLASDPRPPSASEKSTASVARELLGEAKDVVRLPTFQILVAQGVAGSVPWTALTFAAMWLELVGFTHWETSVIINLNQLTGALGSLFAGLIGDPMARRFPNAGRVALAQVSTASTVPVAAVLLLALPIDPSAGAAYAAAFAVLGFVMPWCPPATNNPILAEIVPQKARTTVYALDRFFETIFSSFAPAVVGILAERVFGYKPASSATGMAERENAAALAKAVFAEIAVPMAICCSIYSLLYCTYPADRERAQKAALVAPEDQDCENANSSTATGVDGLNQALLARND
ncbi:hexuronate transporter [Triticum aestivum]|uniref:hexuronate transporter n=1 Tax=Triticum aestivum TaxID=4565 RepID=UPI001D00D376|nr:hexuronate transporter-like [Triticum aestivum]